MKLKERRGAAVCVLLLLASGILTSLAGCAGAQESALFHVSFLKAGKADAIVLWSGEEAIVIDTGEDDDGEKLCSYMESRGIRTIQALIITHFDKDHVGGADILLEHFEVQRIYQPDYEGTGKQYREYMACLDGNRTSGHRLSVQAVTECTQLSVGNAALTIYPSSLTKEEILQAGEQEYDNDLSLVVSAVHGESSFLFTGDAKAQRIRELMKQREDWGHTLLKIPHHGTYNEETEHLLDAVHPEEAVICCSRKNPADQELLKLLEERNIQVWTTMDDTVEAVSDGKVLEISVR